MPSAPKEVVFNQVQGVWLSFWGDVAMWVDPRDEQIKMHEVPRLRKGYTFTVHREAPTFEIKLAKNDIGETIAFFINLDKAYALILNDPDRSQWTETPQIKTGLEGADSS